MKTKMNFGASGVVFSNAKFLRSKQTPSEEKLWEAVRDNKLGVRFRRQHPLAKYIFDFYCHKHKLVIEIDGDIHLDKVVQQEDKSKEETLLALGLTVLRYSNYQVLHKTDIVILDIENKIKSLTLKSPL